MSFEEGVGPLEAFFQRTVSYAHDSHKLDLTHQQKARNKRPRMDPCVGTMLCNMPRATVSKGDSSKKSS